MNVDSIEAGPELDRLCAEHVMGWIPRGPDQWFYKELVGVDERGTVENLCEVEGTVGYSTVMEYALLLEERIKLLGLEREYMEHLKLPGFLVGPREKILSLIDRDVSAVRRARAALKAVGVGRI